MPGCPFPLFARGSLAKRPPARPPLSCHPSFFFLCVIVASHRIGGWHKPAGFPPPPHCTLFVHRMRRNSPLKTFSSTPPQIDVFSLPPFSSSPNPSVEQFCPPDALFITCAGRCRSPPLLEFDPETRLLVSPRRGVEFPFFSVPANTECLSTFFPLRAEANEPPLIPRVAFVSFFPTPPNVRLFF